MDRDYDLMGWLDITPQQSSILEAIISLQKRAEKVNPKNIMEEDSKLRGVPKIQKSNFFSQLKNLQDKEYVSRLGEASYAVNFEAIRKSLEDREESLEEEAAELQKAKEKTELYFKQQYGGEKKPIIAFFEYEDMYSKLANLIKKDDSFYIVGVFPRVLYAHSPSLMHTPEAMKYSQTLWHNCIHYKNLEIKYLTYFDINYIFDKLLRAYGDPKTAYDEIKLILSNLGNLLQRNKNLHIYYSEQPYNVGTVMPYVNDPAEFFLMLRDEENLARGSVYINSPELALRFKHIFDEDCERSIDMKSDAGQKIITELNERLEKVYSKHTKTKSR